MSKRISMSIFAALAVLMPALTISPSTAFAAEFTIPPGSLQLVEFAFVTHKVKGLARRSLCTVAERLA